MTCFSAFSRRKSKWKQSLDLSNLCGVWIFLYHISRKYYAYLFFLLLLQTYPGTSVFFPTLNLEHQVAWCEQVYGIPGMTPDISWTNAYYGGMNIRQRQKPQRFILFCLFFDTAQICKEIILCLPMEIQIPGISLVSMRTFPMVLYQLQPMKQVCWWRCCYCSC